MARDLGSICEFHDAIRVFDTYPGSLHRVDKLNAKTSRLHAGAPSQVPAGEACGKAKIILNPGTHAGLSTRGLSLDQRGLQALRRTINRGGKAGRTAAHDHQIVERTTGSRREAQPFSQFTRSRSLQ